MKRSAIFATIAAVGVTVAVSMVHAQSSGATSWTGFYVGGNLGWGWSSVSQSQSAFGNYFLPSSIASINRTARSQNLNGSGVLAGGQVGYNLQLSSLVLGVEGDIAWLDTKQSASSTAGYPCCAPSTYTLRQSANINRVGTLRARVGITAAPNVLVFATGGLSYADVSFGRWFGDTATPVPVQRAAFSTTRTGWNAGGGIEYALSNSWSVKAEYLFHNLGSVRKSASATIANTTLGLSGSANLDLQTVRVGANYRF